MARLRYRKYDESTVERKNGSILTKNIETTCCTYLLCFISVIDDIEKSVSSQRIAHRAC